ncbi:MAG TPA: apolipoprotein N-acyltransferase [Opitutaceae bacterium]|nr:apolipoprotein N-acyltransferase [Opitutaceae bacterium]
MSSESDLLPPYDPYALRPTFLDRHADAVAAGAVFLFTVVLGVVAFPPYGAPEAAYAMLVPGIFWAYTRPSLKLYAWTLGAAQAVAWTILLGWLHHVTWVGLFLLGPFVGLWIGTWYLAAWWTMPRMLGQPTLTRLVAMIGLAAGWVLIEWTRTWFLTGFPWLPLAASQWQRTSILQVAAYTGSYGISFVLVAVNIGFAAYAHRLFREGATGFNKRSQEFFLALFLLLGCLCVHFQDAFGRYRYQEPFARVAFVQPDIPQDVKWDPAKAPAIVKVLQDTTLAAAATEPDLILWPEASTPWAVRGDPSVKAFVESLAARAHCPLLLGSIAIENSGRPDEKWFNSAFVVSPNVGVQHDYYSKRHLVPFGEYVPLRPLLGWISKFVPIGGDFMPGQDSSPLIVRLKGEPVVFGPLICYEDVFPQLARRSVLAESSVLTVLTNDAWYGESGAAYQHAAHSVLRAVETRRPVLRCGNAGWSGWIDEFGAIRALLTRDTQGRIQTDPRLADKGSVYFRGTATITVMHDTRWVNRQTFYVRHGDWFVALCAGLAALGVAVLLLAKPAAPLPSPTESDS